MWWVMITSHGRLLYQGLIVRVFKDEIVVMGVRLDPGEEIAVLIDRETNRAYLNCPLEIAQPLAAEHYFKLVQPKPPTLLQRMFRLIRPV